MATKSSTNYGGLILRGGIWHMRFTVKGQTVAESTHTSIRRDAERILAKRRAELVEQVVLAGKKPIRLYDSISKFLESREHLPSHQGCSIHIGYFKDIPNHFLDRVTDQELQDVLTNKRREGYAESTLKVSVSYFNAMLKYIGDMGYTVRKKMSPIKHESKRLRWLTKEEYQRLLDALDPQLGLDDKQKAQKQENIDLVQLLYQTGCRRSEITTMRWSQVDFDKGTVFVKRLKDSLDGTLYMTAVMRQVLTRRRALEKGEYVFSSKVASKNEGRWFRDAVKRAKLSLDHGKIVVHTLRHTRAVHLLQAGLNLVDLQKFLGHKEIESTMVYAHVIEDDVMKKAVLLTDGELGAVQLAAPVPAPKP